MKIELIDVQTSSPKHTTDIAILVDKQEFLQEIQRLREKWQITELFPLKKLLGKAVLLDTNTPLYYTSIDKDDIENRLPEFNNDIDKVLKKFNRGKNFRQVVIYALTAGVVPDGIYQSCYFDMVTINEPEDLNTPEKYQYVIVMSPRTEQKELVEAFKEFKKHVKGKIKFQKPRVPLDSPVTQEFTDAVECIEQEKNIYQEEIKSLDKPVELKKALEKFIKNTYKAREYLMTIGDLNIDIPEHKELIEQYYLGGSTYATADLDKFDTKPVIDDIREWYEIRNSKYFNGELDAPLTPAQVCKEWQNKCPINKDKKLIEKESCACKYCIDPVLIMKHLKTYEELLVLS